MLVFLQFGLALIGGGYFVLQGDDFRRHVGALFMAGADDHLAGAADRPRARGFGQGVGRDRAHSGDSRGAGRKRGAGAAGPVGGDIEVRDLTFRYNEGQPALDDLSLTIRSGEAVALLGPPGAGKSTLVNLLVRLYDYQQGSIRIGGRELSGIDRDAVRQAFGMVLQDPFLFSRTVRENVVFGHSSPRTMRWRSRPGRPTSTRTSWNSTMAMRRWSASGA